MFLKKLRRVNKKKELKKLWEKCKLTNNTTCTKKINTDISLQ